MSRWTDNLMTNGADSVVLVASLGASRYVYDIVSHEPMTGLGLAELLHLQRCGARVVFLMGYDLAKFRLRKITVEDVESGIFDLYEISPERVADLIKPESSTGRLRIKINKAPVLGAVR